MNADKESKKNAKDVLVKKPEKVKKKSLIPAAKKRLVYYDALSPSLTHGDDSNSQNDMFVESPSGDLSVFNLFSTTTNLYFLGEYDEEDSRDGSGVHNEQNM